MPFQLTHPRWIAKGRASPSQENRRPASARAELGETHVYYEDDYDHRPCNGGRLAAYDLPGREDAAIALNQRFETLVNKGATRSEVRNGMCLSDYANFGATDTEVRYFVEDLLDRTFR